MMQTNKFDVVSDIFSSLRLRSELYFEADIHGDFAVSLPPEARHVRFHLLRRGTCRIAVDNSGVEHGLTQGDLAIVPHGAGQVLSAGTAGEVASVEALARSGSWDGYRLSVGNGSRRTNLLCGFCNFGDGDRHPLLDTLPGSIFVRQEELGPEPWLSASLRALAMEADLAGPGVEGVMARLLEVVLAQVIRREISRASVDSVGFSAALADIRIARVLQAIHRACGEPWSVATLADRAGMSRAAFSKRFTSVVGMAPFAYLTMWRMTRARNLLEHTRLDMADIAETCGYASVPSFAARFKSITGVGPGAYRRARRDGASRT